MFLLSDFVKNIFEGTVWKFEMNPKNLQITTKKTPNKLLFPKIAVSKFSNVLHKIKYRIVPNFHFVILAIIKNELF